MRGVVDLSKDNGSGDAWLERKLDDGLLDQYSTTEGSEKDWEPLKELNISGKRLTCAGLDKLITKLFQLKIFPRKLKLWKNSIGDRG